jgi:hypothetical protein
VSIFKGDRGTAASATWINDGEKYGLVRNDRSAPLPAIGHAVTTLAICVAQIPLIKSILLAEQE